MQQRASSMQTANRGFTLVEIMVALTISMLLLTGVVTLFANSRSTYESNDRLARIQENGRFALEMIARDVKAAGYWGCAKRTTTKPLRNVLNTPTALLWNFATPVEGFNANATDWTPALTAPASTDRGDTDGGGPDANGPAAGSDILVVRGPKRDTAPQRVQLTMASGTSAIQIYKPNSGLALNDIAIAGSCDQASVFQVTSYTSGAGEFDTIEHVATGTPGNSSPDLNNRFYVDASEIIPVQTVVYFVDTGSAPGSTGTSLWRRTGSDQVDEVVEGVDSMQIEFGIDNIGNNRTADNYVTADLVTDWDQVVSVRIGLLVRSLEEYGTERDNVARQILNQTITAFNDRRQRQIFTTTVTLRNKVF